MDQEMGAIVDGATLDVIVPVHNEQSNLPQLLERLRQTLEPASMRWRVLLVDDGSSDRSAAMIEEAHAEDPRIVLIQLSRNFGHQPAIMAGLHQANADAVVVMDADLQDPPELIADMLKKWREGYEVVYAQRQSRAERGLRRFGMNMFHRVFQWMSDFPMPAQTGVYGLLDRRALEHINEMDERHRFFPGLRAWVGFKQTPIYYDREERAAGKPAQSMLRLIQYALDAIFSFSYKPLGLLLAVGFSVSLLGACIALYFVIKRLVGMEVAFTGFTTLISVILFIGGLQLVGIGLIGAYLGRVYDEVKARPHYIVRRTVGGSSELQERR